MEVVEGDSRPGGVVHKKLRALELEAAGYSYHKDMAAAHTAAHIAAVRTAVHSLAPHTPVARTAAGRTD